MAETKNTAAIKHLRSHYVRFSLDFRPDVLEEFRALCAKNGTTPTTVIKKAVSEYISKNRPEA